MQSSFPVKISIITVCYNSSQHIEEAILSVINQPYTNNEYLIIDGGSTDGTLEIINKYRDKIDYFVSEADKGISDAFNKGIKAATGDLIGILNSDDIMMPDVLSQVAQNYEVDKFDVYRGYCVMWYEAINRKRVLRPNNKFSVPPFGAVICHESSFITKETYKKVGGYKVDFKVMMDLDLFIRMAQQGIRHKFIDVCVITFRVGGASSSDYSKLKAERKKLILQNGGSRFDVFVYLCYHRIKSFFKLIYLKSRK